MKKSFKYLLCSALIIISASAFSAGCINKIVPSSVEEAATNTGLPAGLADYL
jgi:hypothetical protein